MRLCFVGTLLYVACILFHVLGNLVIKNECFVYEHSVLTSKLCSTCLVGSVYWICVKCGGGYFNSCIVRVKRWLWFRIIRLRLSKMRECSLETVRDDTSLNWLHRLAGGRPNRLALLVGPALLAQEALQ